MPQALVVHGGAGARGAIADRTARRRGMLASARRGAEVLRGGGCALDAAIAAVMALEDDPLFNAGFGSTLTAAGTVEMDASLMVFTPGGRRARLEAGAVAAVSRIRNPILVARAVMERTPHVMLVGRGAERVAAAAGVARCRPEEMISPRARQRFDQYREQPVATRQAYGTVGAVAIDARGSMAAATSTGGMFRKLPGRVGDSAIIGAGTFAGCAGAASATGVGEAIIRTTLCHEAVRMLARLNAPRAASRAIAMLARAAESEAGIIMIDRTGGIGFAHNAPAMQVAYYDPARGVRHAFVAPLTDLNPR